MDTFYYKIAEEFSKFPGGRKAAHGKHSGEEFRAKVVMPLLEEHDQIVFDLSDSAGYTTGFLDEAFGELGKILNMEEIKRRLSFVADDDPEAISILWERIEDANNERGL